MGRDPSNLVCIEAPPQILMKSKEIPTCIRFSTVLWPESDLKMSDPLCRCTPSVTIQHPNLTKKKIGFRSWRCEFSLCTFQSMYPLDKLLQRQPVILHSRSPIGLASVDSVNGHRTVDYSYSFCIDQARNNTRGFCIIVFLLIFLNESIPHLFQIVFVPMAGASGLVPLLGASGVVTAGTRNLDFELFTGVALLYGVLAWTAGCMW